MGDYPVPVCLVDTGYALGHPDLPIMPPEVTGVDNPPTGYYERDTWRWDKDFDGHGTHSAGIICGTRENDIGIAGAGKIPIIITRALDDEGNGRESDVRSAVEQCKNAGAKIISLSLGGDVVVPLSQQLYKDYYENEDILFLAAAGNKGGNEVLYPASYEHVMSIGSVDSLKEHAYFSNFNEHVEIAAPGDGVLSTDVTFTAVFDGEKNYPAHSLHGAKIADVEGELVYCGIAGSGCDKKVPGMICFMQRCIIPFSDKMTQCIDYGGVGIIIFNDDEGGATNNWYTTETRIPALSIDLDTGREFYSKVGSIVSIVQKIDEPQFTYSYKTGTSMSTPFVAAAAAKIWSHYPECSNAEIRKALQEGALYKTKEVEADADADADGGANDNDEHNNYYGHGILQTANALNYLSENPCTGSKSRISIQDMGTAHDSLISVGKVDSSTPNTAKYYRKEPNYDTIEIKPKCKDDMTREFYRDKREKKTMTCDKLDKKKTKEIRKTCSVTDVSPSAREVCIETCGMCS